jgi:DNA-binding CsgD family transcriptional regulator
VQGSTLRQANRRAQGMVRAALPEVPAVRRVPEVSPSPAPLTPRERDVLRQLVSGGTNREVGEALGMTPKTVMHHTVAIYRKLGVRGRAEAVAWALRTGASDRAPLRTAAPSGRRATSSKPRRCEGSRGPSGSPDPSDPTGVGATGRGVRRW